MPKSKKPKTFEWTGVQFAPSAPFPTITLSDGLNENAALVFKSISDFERFATAISVAEYHATRTKGKKK